MSNTLSPGRSSRAVSRGSAARLRSGDPVERAARAVRRARAIGHGLRSRVERAGGDAGAVRASPLSRAMIAISKANGRADAWPVRARW